MYFIFLSTLIFPLFLCKKEGGLGVKMDAFFKNGHTRYALNDKNVIFLKRILDYFITLCYNGIRG